MRTDMHAHLWTEDYLDLIASSGKTDTATQRGIGATDSADDLSARFELMDSAGVDLQLLSAAPQLPQLEDETAAVDAARHVNDLYASLVSRHPDRLAALAALPLPHVDAAMGELDRALGELGLVGVAMNTSVLGRSIADPEFEPVYAALDLRGAVLYVHPSGCGAGSPLIGPYGMTWMVGAPIEDIVAAAHLITHGIPSRFPSMKIVISHLGGGLPMLLARMDHQYGWEAPATPERPSDAARRMWFDSASHGHVPALRCACETLGADRIVLGTDYPYLKGDIFRRAVNYVTDAGLSPEEVAGILDRNAHALLG